MAIQGKPGRYREAPDVYEVTFERDGTSGVIQLAKSESKEELLKVARWCELYHR